MKGKFQQGFLGIAFIIIFFAWIPKGYSESYPWVPLNSEDLKMIVDPAIEAEFRLEMVKRAQSSIDIVIYDQRADAEVGMPLLEALRDAANRGVKIRCLTSWSARLIKDPFNYSGHYLTRPPTSTPIDFHIIGGPWMRLSGWGVLDGIHEKLFIVDQRWTLVTGRGHAGEYLHWMDTGFVFRGKLVEQTVSAYQTLWNTLEREKFFESENHGLESEVSPATMNEEKNETTHLPLSRKKLREMKRLTVWLDQPAVLPAALPAASHAQKTYRARLLYFDLLNQLRNLADQQKKNPLDYSYLDRAELLHDPIVEEAIRLISKRGTRDFEFYTLSVTLSPKLKAALLKGVKKGVKVSIFTNGKEAHRSIVPIGIPFGWYNSLQDTEELLKGGVEIFAYTQRSPQRPNFVHRKLAVSGDTVIFGSHNLNLSSSAESDEMSFEVQGTEFANQVRALWHENVKKGGVLLGADEIQEEMAGGEFQEWLSGLLGGMY